MPASSVRIDQGSSSPKTAANGKTILANADLGGGLCSLFVESQCEGAVGRPQGRGDYSAGADAQRSHKGDTHPRRAGSASSLEPVLRRAPGKRQGGHRQTEYPSNQHPRTTPGSLPDSQGDVSRKVTITLARSGGFSKRTGEFVTAQKDFAGARLPNTTREAEPRFRVRS